MSTSGLYAELGLARDASRADIRRAYRRRAKKAHPDAGGSPEAFARLQLAYVVLSDPERRKRYDETGACDSRGADNADADALGVIGQLLVQFLSGDEEPAALDLAKELTQEAKRNLVAIDKALMKSQRVRTRAERLLGRFKTEGGEATPMEGMLRHQIAQSDELLVRHGRAKTAFERAIEILKTWKFDRELSLNSQHSALAQQLNAGRGQFSPYAQRMSSAFGGGLFS